MLFAIEGEWGSGKSFALEKIQECLQVEQSETTNTDRFFLLFDMIVGGTITMKNPIVAIISVLKDQIEQYVSLLSNETKKEMLAIVKKYNNKDCCRSNQIKDGIRFGWCCWNI